MMGLVWVASYFAYQVMQVMHREYCSPNLIHAVLFAKSDACVYLSFAIGFVENTCGRMLYAAIIAGAYHVCRRLGQVQFVPDRLANPGASFIHRDDSKNSGHRWRHQHGGFSHHTRHGCLLAPGRAAVDAP